MQTARHRSRGRPVVRRRSREEVPEVTSRHRSVYTPRHTTASAVQDVRRLAIERVPFWRAVTGEVEGRIPAGTARGRSVRLRAEGSAPRGRDSSACDADYGRNRERHREWENERDGERASANGAERSGTELEKRQLHGASIRFRSLDERHVASSPLRGIERTRRCGRQRRYALTVVAVDDAAESAYEIAEFSLATPFVYP